MKRRIPSLLLALALTLSTPLVLAATSVPKLDSLQMEKSLQALEWKQFRSVIEAIPNLRAEVEQYGPLGWEFVKSRYRTHGWKKNIDHLDESERKRLAQLIRDARKIKP